VALLGFTEKLKRGVKIKKLGEKDALS